MNEVIFSNKALRSIETNVCHQASTEEKNTHFTLNNAHTSDIYDTWSFSSSRSIEILRGKASSLLTVLKASRKRKHGKFVQLNTA